jgi:hypothetical protein
LKTPVLKESVQVLKKAGIVTAAAVALSFVAAPAFAATQDASPSTVPGGHHSDYVSFPEAYGTFIWGGGALGAGAAALVAGAYAGIASTPADILNSLEHHHHG